MSRGFANSVEVIFARCWRVILYAVTFKSTVSTPQSIQRVGELRTSGSGSLQGAFRWGQRLKKRDPQRVNVQYIG